MVFVLHAVVLVLQVCFCVVKHDLVMLVVIKIYILCITWINSVHV